jgi:hypothetical protein
MNQALMQADLAKLPLWSGDAAKDGYTVEQWVKRVDKAAVSAGWDAGNTMSYVYNALRGPALRWYESLKRFNINDNDWPAVRAEMLDAYSRVQTARTAVVNLSDLKQGPSESVTDFGSRVARIVDDLETLMPAASRVPAGVPWDAAITALAGWGGVANDVKAKQLQDAANKVIWNTYNHLGVQLFISNLKPVFRDEMLKAPPTDLNAAIKQARQLEKINSKPENAAAAVSAIQHEAAGGSDDVDAEIAALSAQFQALLKKRNGGNGRGGRGASNGDRGARGGRGRGAPRGGATPNGAASYNVCRYCKKPGHLQKVCNSRIKAGAPQVDAKGKPYTYAQEMEGDLEGAEAAANDSGNPWSGQAYDWESMQEVDFC